MPYLVDARGVLDALGSETAVDDSLPLEPVDLGDEHFEPCGPASIDVRLVNTGAGIVASGTVRARMGTTCARCLVDIEVAVAGAVEGFYVRPGYEDGVPEEQDTLPIEDGWIDLEPVVVQALLVDLPFAPLCREDCRGLCARCGADLNDGACGCPTGDAGHPLASLGRLLSREDADRGGGA